MLANIIKMRAISVLCLVALLGFVSAQQTLTNCKNPKHLAITVDDGGCNWVKHDGILDALKEEGVKASFQVVGSVASQALRPLR